MMGDRRSTLGRWARNLAIALVAAAVVNVAAGLLGPWGYAWSANPLAVAVVGTWLDFVYLFVVPTVVVLLAMEFLAPHTRRPRVVAIGVGAAVGFAYLVFLLVAVPVVTTSANRSAFVVGAGSLFALVGAVYGAVVRLPTRRHVT
jgi:hypothetical protein